MLKKISFVVGALIAGVLLYAAVQPSDYTISREVTINAPAEKIFPHLNQTQLMNDWNPWMKMDRTAKISVSGPAEGVGAKTSWEGGEQLGTGSATVIESLPNQRVVTRLEYTEPFAGTQDAVLSIRATDGGNIVTWSVAGKNGFLGRLMCIFMNMEKMVGGTFEKGLVDLKAKIENSST